MSCKMCTQASKTRRKAGGTNPKLYYWYGCWRTDTPLLKRWYPGDNARKILVKYWFQCGRIIPISHEFPWWYWSCVHRAQVKTCIGGSFKTSGEYYHRLLSIFIKTLLHKFILRSPLISHPACELWVSFQFKECSLHFPTSSDRFSAPVAAQSHSIVKNGATQPTTARKLNDLLVAAM